ncbi:hypothetical protein C823_007258 [Eubacterium plexicaudatum ASF492]|nr:hypothetical protein C823_007258 [Eubacterium plexicaudatum ASF492]
MDAASVRTAGGYIVAGGGKNGCAYDAYAKSGFFWHGTGYGNWSAESGSDCLAGRRGDLRYLFLYCYRREYRLLAEALPLESMPSSEQLQVREAYETAVRLSGMRMRTESVRLLVHDRVRTPLVFGTIRQSIIIPKSLLCQKQQLQYILTHEIVHIRRFDNLWKRLSVAAVCIHWFNPAVWLMYRLFARDLELSCDEQALSAYGSRGRQQYAMTLLMLAQNQMGSALFCSGFLENPVKERIESIMKYKK